MMGEEFRLHMNDTGVTGWSRGKKDLEVILPDSMPAFEKAGALGELERFVHLLKSGGPSATTVKHAYSSMRCCLEMAAEVGVL